ncbi:MAG: hypothetical protein ACD_47C00390G0002 [uncultured bacterium]|nr:MAG: hypothetical protein ACD_47C00390G0002 [uncultured bacterium]
MSLKKIVKTWLISSVKSKSSEPAFACAEGIAANKAVKANIITSTHNFNF